MARPLVIAYHLIWTAYGWWLPNDPRGSTSRGVAEDRIAQLGPHHYGRRRHLPPLETLDAFYREADGVLKFQRLPLGQQDVQHVAEGIAEAVRTRRYTCYACAILPDHVHLVIRKHRDKAEDMIEALQAASGRHGWAEGMAKPQADGAAVRKPLAA
ncbi:MAG: hypothetical protein WBD14_04810 [Phycisphaerae bacterium]